MLGSKSPACQNRPLAAVPLGDVLGADGSLNGPRIKTQYRAATCPGSTARNNRAGITTQYRANTLPGPAARNNSAPIKILMYFVVIIATNAITIKVERH